MLYTDDEWLGICDDGDDYGQGIDCGNDGGLDDVEYGGISGAGASNKNTMYNVDEDEDLDLDSAIEEAQEDYNFGYGEKRYNREGGSRFFGLGRWRRR